MLVTVLELGCPFPGLTTYRKEANVLYTPNVKDGASSKNPLNYSKICKLVSLDYHCCQFCDLAFELAFEASLFDRCFYAFGHT